MTTAVVELDLEGIACHCPADPAGHTPGGDDCLEQPVKPCAVRPFRAGPRPTPNPARGTCPDCGRAGVKVTGAERLGAVASTSSTAAHRVPLGVDIALAAHKRPGKGGPACDCTGPPAEVRFVRSLEIAAWEREHGPGSVR